ncbi:MAG: START-like domain-containing protein [Mangrovibacterium sp.]
MNKIKLECALNCSVSVLFKRLSTPSGLAEWFADEVKQNDEIFTFKWKDYSQSAERIEYRLNEMVCFQWIDGDNPGAKFEFTVQSLELTNDVALIVTDCVDPSDEDSQKELWETQLAHLKRVLGA